MNTSQWDWINWRSSSRHSLSASKIEVARLNEEAPSFHVEIPGEVSPHSGSTGDLLHEENLSQPQPGVGQLCCPQLSSDRCCGGVDRGVHCSGLHEVMF